MHRTRRLLRTVFGALFLAPFVACNSGDNAGTGRLSLLLTDAPGDVAAAVVTIDQVYLVGGEGRTVILDEPFTTNLLELQNTATELVRDEPIPAGTYSELRFVISGGYIELEDGSVYASSPDYAGLTEFPPSGPVTGDLQMPSYGQSGLKVKLPADELVIGDGESSVLLIDFDVSQSFGHRAGGSGRWVMHPVVRATDVTRASRLTVDVTLAQGVMLPSGVTLGNFDAVLTRDTGDGTPSEETLPLTDAGNGMWRADFQLLFAGTYDLTLRFTGTPPAPVLTTDPATPVAVTVGEGASATQTLTVTAATPGT